MNGLELLNEQVILKKAVKLACDALEFSLDHSILETMNKYNRKSINEVMLQHLT